MSKAIVRIDIPTDYADEYKQWIIDGRLCYLEDGAWTFLKEVEYKVEPYMEAIPVEWIKKHYGWLTMAHEMIKDWEKYENRDTESTK